MRAVRALLPSGLRGRLTAWVAAVLLSCAAAVFIVVYQDTGAQLRGQIDRDLKGDVNQLGQALQPLTIGSQTRVAAAARAYMMAQPYTATSTLLFVLLPGRSSVSNHPEVFGPSLPELGETTSEQEQENQRGERLLVPVLGYSTAAVPDVGRVRLLERTLPESKGALVIGAGEPLALVEQAQHGVARAFLLAGALVLAIALIASYFAGARVTAPLRRMAAVATRVDAGDLGPRMDVAGRPSDEVKILADAFNHMLDRLAEAFAGQKAFVADASHELRTPLTVIRGQLEVLAAQENPHGEEVRRVERLVQAEITRIGRLVDDLLLLAQAEQRHFLHLQTIELRAYVDELWDGLSLTAERRFELGPIPEGGLTADPDRLAQAIRNLARNAIEHTDDRDGLVRLEVTRAGAEGITFAVLDDGPGIPASERDRVFERFHRTDSSRARTTGGAGLGLSIVRAIAEAHGGHVRVARAEDGRGTRIELTLPGFAPASASIPLPQR
jgi:two-component system, OmpR family, sensor kinase